jgi:hypothetical protein
METFKAILDFGVLGVLLAVLVGLFLLVRQFAPQLIATWIAMTTTLAKLGEQVDNFGAMVIGLGVKVDATRDRASAAAQSASDTKTALERSGSFPGINAGQAGAPPPAPPRP